MSANGPLFGIVKRMHEAQQHLKWPQVRLVTADHNSQTEIVLKVAGIRSRYRGSISVVSPGSFESATFYGRISTDGFWHPHDNAKTTGRNGPILAALVHFNDNPAEAARIYGQRVGNCCFCGLELTHPDSLAVGYGPICAEKYGLPHGGSGTQGGETDPALLQEAYDRATNAIGRLLGDMPDIDPTPLPTPPPPLVAIPRDEQIALICEELTHWLNETETDTRTIHEVATACVDRINNPEAPRS